MTKYEKDDRGPLDLTRQIGELQCEIAGLKTKVHDESGKKRNRGIKRNIKIS